MFSYFKERHIYMLLVVFAFFVVGSQDFNDATEDLGQSPLTITLTENGFIPEDITITEGDTITFKNETGNFFWPASDLHPSHGVYPAFDPKEPIKSGLSWSFQFNQPGTWKYHDHLAPYFTGNIIVEPKTENGSSLPTTDACDEDKNSPRCLRQEVLTALKTRNLDEVFDMISAFYASNPDASSSCHDLAHEIGHDYYKLKRTTDITLSPKAVYCASGFYHGFGESIVDSKDGALKAKEFCDRVEKELSSLAPDSGLQCYHGIGHGSIRATIGDGPRNNEEDIITPALKLCESISSNENQLYRCTSGAFNDIANAYISKGYKGVVVNEEDPLWLCHKQPQKYKESCYGNMNATIFWLGKGEFLSAAKFVEAIKDEKLAQKSIEYLAGLAAVQTYRSSPEKPTLACRSLQSRLYVSCIKGFTHGFLEHGRPNKEYEDALSFCNDENLNTEEEDICKKYVYSSLHGWYSAEKTKGICDSAEAIYQPLCEEK